MLQSSCLSSSSIEKAPSEKRVFFENGKRQWYIIYLRWFAVKHINKWELWAENFPIFFCGKKVHFIHRVLVIERVSANADKTRILSGEMVTFLLSRAVVVSMAGSDNFPPSEAVRHPKLIFYSNNCGKDMKFVFLISFCRCPKNIIIFFCHTWSRRATLFMMNKFMFCRLKKWVITQKALFRTCGWSWCKKCCLINIGKILYANLCRPGSIRACPSSRNYPKLGMGW